MTLAELLQMAKRQEKPKGLAELQRRVNGSISPLQPGQKPQVPPHWIGVRG